MVKLLLHVRVALSSVSFQFSLSLPITLIHAGKLPLHKAIVSNEIFFRHTSNGVFCTNDSPSPPSCLSVSHKHSNIQSMAIFCLPPPPANSFEQRFLLSNLSTYQKVDAIARLKCEQNDTRWRGFVTDCHYLLLRCDALLHDNCSLCVCTRAMFQMIADFKCNFLCRALFECLSIHLH